MVGVVLWVDGICVRRKFGQVEGDGIGSSSGIGGPENVLQPLQKVLDRLTKALLHEERRCRYVSREVRVCVGPNATCS